MSPIIKPVVQSIQEGRLHTELHFAPLYRVTDGSRKVFKKKKKKYSVDFQLEMDLFLQN
jgi:hypothetical protein